jgi:hypothetical protein
MLNIKAANMQFGKRTALVLNSTFGILFGFSSKNPRNRLAENRQAVKKQTSNFHKIFISYKRFCIFMHESYHWN